MFPSLSSFLCSIMSLSTRVGHDSAHRFEWVVHAQGGVAPRPDSSSQHISKEDASDLDRLTAFFNGVIDSTLIPSPDFPTSEIIFSASGRVFVLQLNL